MKNLMSNIGTVLTKEEQKSIQGSIGPGQVVECEDFDICTNGATLCYLVNDNFCVVAFGQF